MSAPPPPPAAMIAPVRESMALTEKLQRLQAELDAVLAQGELDAHARVRLLRAEAITDRILESDPPVAWLASDYGVEAWLRQLQALADRIVAQVRREEPEARIMSDVARLRETVAELRAELDRSGGGPPPPSLDSLLANYTAGEMPTDVEPESGAGTGGADRDAAGPDVAGESDEPDRRANPRGEPREPAPSEPVLLGVPRDSIRG